MKQFNDFEIKKLQKKAKENPQIIEWLKKESADVLKNELIVPTTGIATWNLYYFCPKHSVRLEWRIDSPLEHRCPVDGEVLKGEPYDGAWWRWMNGLNAKACYDLGLLWQLTGEKRYLDKVREILLEYAKHYPDYEEHGGIPYNGPGKANAQTLCEANCHKDFTLGYDLVAEGLGKGEREYIEERLLREGAEFLVKHRSDQLHNHEVKISGTIGLIGLILDDENYLDFAINSKYGLLYQLEKGISLEGLWFEGSVHYHYYALQGLFTFEKAARNSKYSNLDHPNFKKMLSLPLTMLLPNNTFPKLNDCIKGQEVLNHTDIFEFAYGHYGDDQYGMALNRVYAGKERNNIHAFLYGAEKLPKEEMRNSREDIHYKECGITVFKGRDSYFLLKHTPYGGEHDHYDRLGMIFYNNGEEIFNDLGTTGYGATLHYDYYKNTATHNTIVVEGKNQPPVDPVVLKYEDKDGYKIIDTMVDWSEKYGGLDSFTRVQWCNESYRGMKYRRTILWLDGCFAEVVKVKNPHKKDVNYCLHTLGSIENQGEKISGNYREEGPLRYIKSIEKLKPEETIKIGSEKNLISMHHYSEDSRIYKGKGPGNPSVSDIDYLFIESSEQEICYINVFDYTSEGKSENISVKKNGETIQIERGDKGCKKLYTLVMKDSGAEVCVR